MCGRFSLGLPRNEIRRLPLEVQVEEWVFEDDFIPRHNIAPHSQAPVLLPSSSRPNSLVLHTMKWGLVPSWNKQEKLSLNTTNARSENIIEGGGMWSSIKGKNRCAIPCEGYFEWLTKGKEKLPHFTKHENGNLMFLAGMYDTVIIPGSDKPLWTFTIVTTAANKEFNWLHDRQPVILSTRKALDTWLDTTSQQWYPELTKLVQPYHDAESPLQCYAVPKEVGKVGTESAAFILPVSERKDGIEAMFSQQWKSQLSSSSQTTSSPSSNKRARSFSPNPAKTILTKSGEPPDTTSSPPTKKMKMKAPDVKAAKKTIQKTSTPPKSGVKTKSSSKDIASFFKKA